MAKLFFIGGPGNLSTSTLDYCLSQGHQVAIFKRNAIADSNYLNRVNFFLGDRSNPKLLAQALNDFKPDYVVDFACFTPQDAQQLYGLLKGKIGHFLHVSTVDVYGYPLARLPFRESDFWHPTNCEYARLKLEIEQFYAAKFKALDFPLTIVRPAYSFGNDFLISFLSRDSGSAQIERLRSQQPVYSPGDGTTLFHVGTARNTGKMIGRILLDHRSIGRDYTVGHPQCTTHDGYLHLMANALGVEPNIVHIPTDFLYQSFPVETRASLLNDLTRFNLAFSMDKFSADFPDFIWEQSLQEAMQEYLRYNDANGTFARLDKPLLEDRVIAAYQQLLKL